MATRQRPSRPQRPRCFCPSSVCCTCCEDLCRNRAGGTPDSGEAPSTSAAVADLLHRRSQVRLPSPDWVSGGRSSYGHAVPKAPDSRSDALTPKGRQPAHLPCAEQVKQTSGSPPRPPLVRPRGGLGLDEETGFHPRCWTANRCPTAWWTLRTGSSHLTCANTGRQHRSSPDVPAAFRPRPAGRASAGAKVERNPAADGPGIGRRVPLVRRASRSAFCAFTRPCVDKPCRMPAVNEPRPTPATTRVADQ